MLFANNSSKLKLLIEMKRSKTFSCAPVILLDSDDRIN